jgi:hypothetical protein
MGKTVSKAQRDYAVRPMTPEILEHFKQFYSAYIPRRMASRINDMFIYYCRAMAKFDEGVDENLYDLTEDLLAINRLFKALDLELIPPPDDYVDSGDEKTIRNGDQEHID